MFVNTFFVTKKSQISLILAESSSACKNELNFGRVSAHISFFLLPWLFFSNWMYYFLFGVSLFLSPLILI